MRAPSFLWDEAGNLYAGAIETPVAEVRAYGGHGSPRLPAFVAIVHLPGAPKPKGGGEVETREQVEVIVRRWLRRALG